MLFVLMYVAYALFSYFLEINMDGSSGDLTKDGIANDLEWPCVTYLKMVMSRKRCKIET